MLAVIAPKMCDGYEIYFSGLDHPQTQAIHINL